MNRRRFLLSGAAAAAATALPAPKLLAPLVPVLTRVVPRRIEAWMYQQTITVHIVLEPVIEWIPMTWSLSEPDYAEQVQDQEDDDDHEQDVHEVVTSHAGGAVPVAAAPSEQQQDDQDDRERRHSGLLTCEAS